VTRAALVLAALLLTAPSAVARVSGGTPVALVTAETENQLIAVRFPDGKVLRRLTVPADPQNVVADQRTAVVVSPGSGAVTLLDARTLKVRKVLRGLGAPHVGRRHHAGPHLTDDQFEFLGVLVNVFEVDRVDGQLARRVDARRLGLLVVATDAIPREQLFFRIRRQLVDGRFDDRIG
jgi:hypothetical protein